MRPVPLAKMAQGYFSTPPLLVLSEIVNTRAPNLADDEGVHIWSHLKSYVESATKIAQVTYWLRRGDLLVESLGDLLFR